MLGLLNKKEPPLPRAHFVHKLLIFALYPIIAKLSLTFPLIPPNVTLIWLPTGIAVTALILWGRVMLWPLFLGAIAFNIWNEASLFASCTLAAITTLASFVCYRYLRYKNFHQNFYLREDVINLGLGAAFSMLISSTLSCFVLAQLEIIPNMQMAWLSWWVGDVLGVMLGYPFFYFVLSKKMRLTEHRQEFIIYCVIFFIAHHYIFLTNPHLSHFSFLPIIIIIWSAIRFSHFITYASLLITSSVSLYAMGKQIGPYVNLASNDSSLVLAIYVATLVITALMIIAIQNERAHANNALVVGFERMNKIASRLPGLIVQFRMVNQTQTETLYVSDFLLDIFELTPAQIKFNVEIMVKKIDPQDKKRFITGFMEADKSCQPYEIEFRVLTQYGQRKWIHMSAIPELEQEGDDKHHTIWHCFISDITDRKKAEQELQIAAITFESQECIFVLDTYGQVLKINHAFSKVTGFSPTDLVHKTYPRYINEKQTPQFYKNIIRAINKEGYWQGELWAKKKNGEIYPQLTTITAIYNLKKEITHYVGAFNDISLTKNYENEIFNLAFYDSLTHLPNRRLLMDRLQQLVAISHRDDNYRAVLFLDLDNFKTLNDTRGHDSGDLLLIETAQRLQACVREGDTVARLGGDEFVIVLESISIHKDEAVMIVERIAEKIRKSLSEPYEFTDFVHHGGTSIGVSLFQGKETTVKDLFKRADTAMYEAKTSGKNTIRFFDPAMQAVLVVRMMLESNLRVALAMHQFQLYYQLQVDAQGRIIGAEALLRWIHPDRGFISPAEFIPVAEQTGLIVPIGNWALDNACNQLKKWAKHPKTSELTIAVNVSAKQFQQEDFVATVTEALLLHNVNPSRLKIELTESTVLDNVELTTEKMHQLKRLGISFSMDDFGTGYSSLAYLQKLPLDQLKIDQSFIRDIDEDESDAAIVRTIIALGNNLGLQVIAEGVETHAQRRFLIEHNCLSFQGYLFSKPYPIDELEDLIFRDTALQQLQFISRDFG